MDCNDYTDVDEGLEGCCHHGLGFDEECEFCTEEDDEERANNGQFGVGA